MYVMMNRNSASLEKYISELNEKKEQEISMVRKTNLVCSAFEFLQLMYYCIDKIYDFVINDMIFYVI